MRLKNSDALADIFCMKSYAQNSHFSTLMGERMRYSALKASTDGYQLAAYNMPHFIAQSIKFKTKYNVDNLEPIAVGGL